MKKRNIDLSGPEGNVFCVLGIVHDIVLDAKGPKEAGELKDKVFSREFKTYKAVLDYFAEKAKECDVELVYENRYKM